ncbi:MAG: alkaline phosphatase family protein [Chlamydiales bacterium]|nr:alkaline phosphatase family protein [Chlamydiales bacterium]
MRNERSIKACDEMRFGPFNKPLYDSYCFSRIPNTVRSLLTGPRTDALPQDTFEAGEYEFVLVLLVDSFGWQYFERFKDDYPFLKRFMEEGIVSKITSQFPSTTTNHITCMHTGLSVGQSGLYEWFYYEPTVDSCICPLHFSYAKDSEFNTLAKDGVQANDLFCFKTIYEDLSEQGIKSYAFQEKNTANSPYSQAMYKGAEVIGYKSFPEGLSKLLHTINGLKQKSYLFFYFGDIDSAGHEFGPNSPEVLKQVDKCFSRLENFWKELTAKKRNGCVILCADHGMGPISPTNCWYINQHLPHFERYIKRNKKGELLIPCGSSRDMFLHIKDEFLDHAYTELSTSLANRAEVHKTEDLIKKGLFGPVTTRFLDRVGNLVILPYQENSVWWYDPARFKHPYHGHHGGLTPAEVETIFLFQKV